MYNYLNNNISTYELIHVMYKLKSIHHMNLILYKIIGK